MISRTSRTSSVASLASTIARTPPVSSRTTRPYAAGVVEHDGEQGGRRAALPVGREEALQGLRPQEGDVAVDDEERPVGMSGEDLARDLDGVAGPEGRLLPDEREAASGEGRLDRLRLMTDDDGHG